MLIDSTCSDAHAPSSALSVLTSTRRSFAFTFSLGMEDSVMSYARRIFPSYESNINVY